MHYIPGSAGGTDTEVEKEERRRLVDEAEQLAEELAADVVGTCSEINKKQERAFDLRQRSCIDEQLVKNLRQIEERAQALLERAELAGTTLSKLLEGSVACSASMEHALEQLPHARVSLSRIREKAVSAEREVLAQRAAKGGSGGGDAVGKGIRNVSVAVIVT